MKLKIEKYKFIKQLEEGFEADLPEEPVYLFQFGVRTSHAIIPVWTTWEKEHHDRDEYIWKYIIISVDSQWESNMYIKSVELQVSSIGEQYNSKQSSQLSDLVKLMIDGIPEDYIRTKERFLVDYNRVLNHINEQVG